MSSQSAIFNPTLTTSAASGSGFSVPRLTTTGRLAIAFGTGDSGMMVYDTTLNNLFIWTGSAWESVPASGDAGVNGAVQYNDNGVVSGATNFVYNKVNQKVGIGTITPNVELDVVGNATISGDLTVATNRLIVNSVGVSTGGSPAVNFGFTTVGKTGGIFANKNATAQYLAFQMKNSTQDYAVFIDQDGIGSNSWSIFDNTNAQTAIRYYPGVAGSWNFHQNGGVAASVTAAELNLVSRNVKLSSGNGIDFSATASGSGTMTSELLNDYEEGTWTPTDASGAGLAFTVSNCRYTKVGRSVTIQGNITYPATASTANATWGGFPFNSPDLFNLSINYSDASVATLTYISSNGGNAFLLTPGLNTQNVTVSGKYIGFSGTYMI